MDDWTAVELEISRIVAESSERFDPATVAHVSDFLTHVRNRCPIPIVGKGHWSTIRFTWGSSLEIEIFEDRLEIYRFFDRRTDIRHLAHLPGEPFPLELTAELPVA